MSNDDDLTAHQLLQDIYRNEQVPLPVRMRAAIESLPYETPKLMAVANVTEGSFAKMLDRAIERSRPLKMIELKPEPTTDNNVQHPAEELKKPFAKLRRV
jgi:hypothetical protein